MSDSNQLVRMIVVAGPYNAGELRGMYPERAEELRLANVCEFVSKSSSGEVKVTRLCKRDEDAKNVDELRQIRMEKGLDAGLFTDEDVADMLSKIKSLESKAKQAMSAVGPLKKEKSALSEELKVAREDNKAASKAISALKKDNEKLEAEVASLGEQLSEAAAAPAKE